jgi:hypothetical protein
MTSPTLLDLHREADAQETMLAIIAQWPHSEALAFLRDNTRRMLDEVEADLAGKNKRLRGEQ